MLVLINDHILLYVNLMMKHGNILYVYEFATVRNKSIGICS